MPKIRTREEALALFARAKQTGLVGKRGKAKKTLLKEEAYKELQKTIIARSQKLLNAQTMLGLGTIKVFRVDAHYEMFGKQRKLVKERPKIVTDEEEIISVLDHEYGDGESPDTPFDEYPKFYFVETKDANNNAIDSQLDRVFGKATNKTDLTSGGKPIVPQITGMQIIFEQPKKQIEGKIVDITPDQPEEPTQ